MKKMCVNERYAVREDKWKDYFRVSKCLVSFLFYPTHMNTHTVHANTLAVQTLWEALSLGSASDLSTTPLSS